MPAVRFDWGSAKLQPFVAARPPDGAKPLVCSESGLNVDVQEFYAQRRRGLALGLPQLTHMLPPSEAPVAIVGSGPTITQTLPELRRLIEAGAQVVAVKRAHEWLLDHGIVPDFAVHCDAQEETARVFARPQKATTYLVASHCHPSIWDRLRGHNVLQFHCKIRDDDAEWDRSIKRVGGGSTTGERAIVVMYLLGMRTGHLFGFDSIARDDGVFRIEGANTVCALEPDEQRIEVWIDGQTYTTTQGLYGQVRNLRCTIEPLKGLALVAHGDGLFQAYLRKHQRTGGWPA